MTVLAQAAPKVSPIAIATHLSQLTAAAAAAAGSASGQLWLARILPADFGISDRDYVTRWQKRGQKRDDKISWFLFMQIASPRGDSWQNF